MSPDRLEFLIKLLETPGVSGFERRASQLWARKASAVASVHTDHYGNTFAVINEGASQRGEGLRIMLSGHIDEIGLIVSYVNPQGFASVLGIGGWDAEILPGQRVRLYDPQDDEGKHDRLGVIGKKPIHLIDKGDRSKASKLEELWIDFGLEPGQSGEVKVGDVCVLEQPVCRLGAHRLVSKALDNRVGAFCALEALHVLAERGCRHEVIAVASVQEEIGALGARLAAFAWEPQLAIALDLTFETAQPGVDVRSLGVCEFGSGANLTVGPLVNPVLTRGLLETAQQQGIPVTTAASGRRTGTDADEIIPTRAGVPSAVVSLPNRYMHSPSEMVDLRDVQAVIDLLAAYLLDLPRNTDFRRLMI